jgi:Tol biopolymer transport system component
MQDAGARFGPYEVKAPLGAGGMGEVYRAVDTRLGREVALKVLPAGAAADPQRLRRFELEARAAGALNHPNVVGILDLGTQDGRPYAVSELLEGETFRDRVRIAAFPVKKAIDLAIQMAHGLAAAHDKGIVHRDLKPENLFLTRDGRVKILDFGLAKLRQDEPESGATRTSDLADTESGTVLGTIGYMAPEQVRGLPADARADVFALGAVLYEMVTGRRAFRRDTAAETMTAILKDDPPDLRGIVPGAPIALEKIVRRCLEKSRDERFHSARDVAYALETVPTTSFDTGSPVPTSDEGAVTAAPARGPSRPRRWWIAAALIASAVAVSALLLARAPATDLAAYRFTPVATEGVYEGSPAWSPDGGTLAYVREASGILQVFTRRFGEAMAAQITQAPRDCREPFWSADGSRVYYVSQAAGEESLWSVSAAGGTPQVMVRGARTAALSRDGATLAFLRDEGSQVTAFQTLYVASPPGAEPRKYVHPPFAGRHAATGFLRFSPDGSRLALWMVGGDSQPGTGGTTEFWLLPLAGGTPERVAALGGAHVPYPFDWMPDGRHVVFGTDRIARTPGLHLWMADVVSGATTPVTATTLGETYPAVSPGGKRIAFTSQDERYHLIDIAIDGGAGGYRTTHTASGMETDPAWSPQGGQYAFVTDRSGRPEIWLRSRDGAFERPLVTSDSFKDSRGTSMFSSLSFSPDGRRIAFQQATAGDQFGVWVSTIAGGPPVPIPAVAGAHYQDSPTWSPDGEWVAFTYGAKGKWGLAKVHAGGDEAPIVLRDTLVYPSTPRWSPRGDWIACDTTEGFTLVSPDGKTARVLSDEAWLAHGFSKDGTSVYAVRQTDSLRMQLTRFDVATGRETIVTEDLGATPPTSTPLRGFSLAPDGRSFLASIVELRGDVWVLDGFSRPTTMFDRIRSLIAPRAVDEGAND